MDAALIGKLMDAVLLEAVTIAVCRRISTLFTSFCMRLSSMVSVSLFLVHVFPTITLGAKGSDDGTSLFIFIWTSCFIRSGRSLLLRWTRPCRCLEKKNVLIGSKVQLQQSDIYSHTNLLLIIWRYMRQPSWKVMPMVEKTKQLLKIRRWDRGEQTTQGRVVGKWKEKKI